MTKSDIAQIRHDSSQTFIEENLHEDPSSLIIKHSKQKNLPIKLLVGQIQAKQKAKLKLPSFYVHTGIIYPPLLSMEQCSSELAARYKSQLAPGNSITDLTGGFGIDLYYFSLRYKQAIYVEQQHTLAALSEHNFEALGATNIIVHHSKAEQYLECQNHESDVYYLDPARRDDNQNKVFLIEDCTPNLVEIIPTLLSRKKVVLIKLAPMLDIQLALRALPHVAEVHVVSVKNECKELLFLIKPAFFGTPKIVTINLSKENPTSFEYNFDDEYKKPEFSLPKKYLYEPNASIMKAGAFNSVALRFGLQKLHTNTHLYTSEVLVNDFPGRRFEIRSFSPVNKKKLSKILPDKKANITVRNYPSSVANIRKKTGLIDGGDSYLFACTLLDETLVAIICNQA